MTLTQSDKDRLGELLESNRKGRSKTGGNNRRPTSPVTDHDTVLSPRGNPTDGHRRFHAYSNGDPACDSNSSHDYKPWDPEVALDWLEPCAVCYPDGYPHDEVSDQ